MSRKLTSAEQAEALRIRMLIGPMKDRDDTLIEIAARNIEKGEWGYDPDTCTIIMEEGHTLGINPDGSFKSRGEEQ
jgi:hypothetical protein